MDRTEVERIVDGLAAGSLLPGHSLSIGDFLDAGAWCYGVADRFEFSALLDDNATFDAVTAWSFRALYVDARVKGVPHEWDRDEVYHFHFMQDPAPMERVRVYRVKLALDLLTSKSMQRLCNCTPADLDTYKLEAQAYLSPQRVFDVDWKAFKAMTRDEQRAYLDEHVPGGSGPLLSYGQMRTALRHVKSDDVPSVDAADTADADRWADAFKDKYVEL